MNQSHPVKNLPHIILVHGLFMPGVSMIFMRNFFEKQGYNTTIFSYHSIMQSTEKSAEDLKDLLDSIHQDCIIICHSLGGLLTQKTLEMMDNPAQRIQKVISLGTPWQGASILTFMQKYKLDGVVGKSLEILLPKTENQWQFKEIALASIAGKSSIGARLLFTPGKKIPTDGTVTINETQIKGMTAHTIIPISHTGLIFSNLAAQKALEFIETNQLK